MLLGLLVLLELQLFEELLMFLLLQELLLLLGFLEGQKTRLLGNKWDGSSLWSIPWFCHHHFLLLANLRCDVFIASDQYLALIVA